MKRSFLGKLQRTAFITLSGALVLLLIVPLLQLVVLGPQGYGAALATLQGSLAWIQGHIALFLLYRAALILGFALLLGMPFALFRIIIAQEIIGRAELGTDEDEASEDVAVEEAENGSVQEEHGLPTDAWRGKGFAVLAAWAALAGLLLLTVGLLASTFYLASSAGTVTTQTPLPGNFVGVSSFFAILAYTVGGGLLALACLCFGFVIARSGRKLWPDSWVAFGYAGLALGALASGSAVEVALAPTGNQALTTPTILLFAIWSFWFSIMVVRLKSE